MNDAKRIVGFVKNHDGFWWIVSDDECASVSMSASTSFRSIGDDAGVKVLRTIKSAWLNNEVNGFGDIKSYIKYARSILTYRASKITYDIVNRSTMRINKWALDYLNKAKVKL